MVAKACHRSPRYIAAALGFHPAYRRKFRIPHEILEAAGPEIHQRERWAVSCAIAAKMVEKKSIAAERIECSTGRTELACAVQSRHSQCSRS
jgi:hypothetical protein